MRVPEIVLAQLRAPLLAAAVAGCSTASPASVPEPVEPAAAPEPLVAALIDPVRYDVAAETERLERADRTLVAAETRRARRIEAEEEQARRRAFDRAIISNVGVGASDRDWILAACGRG